MFVVTSRCYSAPKSRGGKYRRPVVIRVLDSSCSEWHAVRRLKPGLVREWANVDSRYRGPKSAHGIALREAKELADRLNLQLTEEK